MKKITAIILAVLMLSTLAACASNGTTTTTPTQPATQPPASQATTTPPTTEAPPVLKEITIGRDYDANTLDLQNTNIDGAYLIIYMACEGLVRNDNGNVTPGVAEKWDVSADETVYTFHLRSDAKWSDGSPLTAADFEYSYKRMLNPEFGLENAGLGFVFKNGQEYYNGEKTADDVGVKALDATTLEITFANPSLETLYTMARYQYYPVNKAMVEAQGVGYGSEADKVLTNGPFNITQWLHEDRIILEKNENYWNKDAIKLTKVTNIIGLTTETAADMMATDTLDIFVYRDYKTAMDLEGNGFDVTPIVKGYQFIQMNASGSSPELAKFMGNANFRKALNLVVSREAITSAIYIGYDPTTRYSSPTMMGVNKAFNEEYPLEGWPKGGDAEKAKECFDLAMQELGTKASDVPPLSLLCFESQNGMLMFQAVQDMLLSNLGIQSTINPQPIQQMIEKAMAGEWDMWWGGMSLGALDWASPDSFGISFDYTEGTKDFIQYKNQAYTDLYQKTKVAKTIKERKDLMFEMEKILCEDPPAILVGWTQNWAVYSSKLSNFMMSSDPVFIYMDLAE